MTVGNKFSLTEGSKVFLGGTLENNKNTVYCLTAAE